VVPKDKSSDVRNSDMAKRIYKVLSFIEKLKLLNLRNEKFVLLDLQ
jgi:hypothetical protein